MNYRPITDIWFLARAKLKEGKKYYGAYLGGFPERARALIGAPLNLPMLHVCGGMARHYPYKAGFGPLDKTLDLDPQTNPDYLQNATEPYPDHIEWKDQGESKHYDKWAGILIDPPYSEADAEHYAPGRGVYPKPNLLLKTAINVLQVGRKVGIIHYILPSPPKNARFVAAVGVLCGFNNRVRVFSVFERTE